MARPLLLLALTAGLLQGTAIRAQEPTAGEVIEINADVVYGHKLGLALTYDVLRPTRQPNGAAVLFMVSGGWKSSWSPPESAARRFRFLLERGFTMILVRHGSSPRFTVPECVADVRRAVRHVRANAKRFSIDPDRLGVFGGSAGGHLSLMLGTGSDDGNPKAKDPLLKVSNRVAAVVALFPPTDLAPYVLPESGFPERYPALKFDTKLADANSPLKLVSSDDAPSLMIHGDKDKLVPLEHSQKIHAAFQKNKVASRLLVIKDAAHGFRDADNTRAEQATVEWFAKYLVRPASAKETSK